MQLLMDAKTIGLKSDEEQDSIKVSLPKLLINYNGENKTFGVDKTKGHHLNQVIKINITKNGENWHYMLPECFIEKDTTSIVFFYQKFIT